MRLTQPARDDYHRLELLRDFAQTYRCLVLLKGAYSCLATPQGELHFNGSGNPGMATGGSGDVLINQQPSVLLLLSPWF